ncbi:MAG: hypothetical protein WKF49_05435 [Thermoleophilaceae bacterium]
MTAVDWGSSNLGFAASCAVDVVIVCAAAWWLARRPAASRLAVALVFATCVLAVKGLVLLANGVTIPFGVLHVLWLDLGVALPLAGVTYLAAGRGRTSRWSQAIAVAAVLAAPFAFYAGVVEPGGLTTERTTVGLAPERAGQAPIRVAVLSDLQFEHLSEREAEAVARAMSERPDLILLTGDIHQGSPKALVQELVSIRELLGGLHAAGGVFAVQGDVESVGEARAVTAGTGVRLLRNDVVRTTVRDRAVTIAGMELAWDSPAARRAAARLETSPRRGDVRLLLAHRPDAALPLSRATRIDLTVAGHTHGGQVQLPLIGPLMTASKVPREVAGGGLHDLAGKRIYVSRGIGVERDQAPRIRFGAKPEVTILTLR